MPELPDVEVFKRYLDATSLHREVRHAFVPASRVLGKAASTLRSHLEGRRLEESHRHGKYLLARLAESDWLVLHFGMTGFLEAYGSGGSDEEHVRLRLDFSDGGHLAYHDQRLLGQVDLAESPQALLEERGLGPDALDADLGLFRERLEGHRGAVKPTLMNQSVLAGLGNVYSDEILFQAEVHPETPVPALDEEAVGTLHRVMWRVLRKAIVFKAEPAEAPASWLLPRREEGAPCPRCKGRIERLVVSGRAAYLCPACQKRRG